MTVTLQTGAVGLELLIVFGIAAVLFLASLAVSVWIYRDAKSRNDDHAFAWGAGSFLGWFLGGIGGVVVWVLYLVVREDDGPGAPSVRGESE